MTVRYGFSAVYILNTCTQLQGNKSTSIHTLQDIQSKYFTTNSNNHLYSYLKRPTAMETRMQCMCVTHIVLLSFTSRCGKEQGNPQLSHNQWSLWVSQFLVRPQFEQHVDNPAWGLPSASPQPDWVKRSVFPLLKKIDFCSLVQYVFF